MAERLKSASWEDASFKIGKDSNPLVLPDTTCKTTNLLEDPASARIRELSELVRLLESDLITLEEFNNVKRQLFIHEGFSMTKPLTVALLSAASLGARGLA